MTETPVPPGPDGPDFTGTTGRAPARSAVTAGTFGCMAGAGIGVAGAILFAGLLMAGLDPRPAALVSVPAALAGGVALFRRFRRDDPPVAVGLLIGLALMGLLVGMCTGQFL